MNFPSNLPPWTIGSFYLLTAWSLIWKGLALWKAAKGNQQYWFILLLIVNTFGLLDIIYLFRFAKTRMSLRDIASWFQKTFLTKQETKKSSK